MTDISETRRLNFVRTVPAVRRPVVAGGLTNGLQTKSIFNALWRGKGIIALLMSLALGVGVYIAYFAITPVYKSTATVILNTTQERITGLDTLSGGLTGDTTEVNSEIEILRARSLLGKVVDRLNLKSDPEFNRALQTPSAYVSFKAQVKDALGLRRPPLALATEEHEARTRDAVISELKRRISVQNVRQSIVFNVTAQTEDPRKSKLIADTIVELYILNQIEVKFEAMRQATEWLTTRVAELQVDLEKAEEAVSSFSASTELVSADALQGLERRIKFVRDRIALMRANEKEFTAQLEDLQTAGTAKQKAEIAKDTQLSDMLQRLNQGSASTAQFDAYLSDVTVRIELDLSRAKQQLLSLEASERDLASQIEKQGQDLIQLQHLTRDAEATRLLYEHFLLRLKETSAQQGIQQADSRILSAAVVPIAPSAPRRPLILAMAAVLGLVIGAGLVLLREHGNTRIRSAQDLEAHTRHNVMGQIPKLPRSAGGNVVKYLSAAPESATADAIRKLRTSLLLSRPNIPPKVIVSTSAIPGEGKTALALSFAHSFRQAGSTVLFIGWDTQESLTNEIPPGDIVSVLQGTLTVADAIFRHRELDCDVLTGVYSRVSAADIFATEEFAAFLKEMRLRYDVIIIDTPPVLMAQDACVISHLADAVLCCVKWDSTPSPLIDETMRVFQNYNQRITGFVLSHISPKGLRRYGHHAYGTPERWYRTA